MGSPPWRGIPFPGAFIKEAHSTTGAGTATEIDVRVNAKVWKSGKVILAVELDGFHSAVFVKLFALAKLAARNIGWIAGCFLIFDCSASARFCISSLMDGSCSFGVGLSRDFCGVGATMTLFLGACDYRRRARNRWLFLVGRRAVLRLRRGIERWTAHAAGVTSCSRTESGDIAAELAAGIPSVHRGVDFFFWHWNASISSG